MPCNPYLPLGPSSTRVCTPPFLLEQLQVGARVVVISEFHSQCGLQPTVDFSGSALVRQMPAQGPASTAPQSLCRALLAEARFLLEVLWTVLP